MTELQQTLYQMLKEIHGICVEHQIHYTLHPLLALFLENDMDIPAHYESRCVYMMPGELSRFISVCGASLPPGRSLESVRSNPRYPFLYSARYINTETLCLEFKDGPNYLDNGLFIRVEALRSYPASKVKKKLVSLLEQGWFANTYQSSIDYTKKIILSKVIVRCMMVVGRKRLGNWLFDLAMRAYQSKNKMVAVTWRNVNRFFPKSLFRRRLFVLAGPEEDENAVPDEDVQDETVLTEDMQDETVQDEAVSGEDAQDETVSGEDAQDEAVSGEDAQDEAVSGEDAQDEAAPGEDAQDEAVSGEDAQDEAVSGEDAQDEAASGEDAQDEAVSGEDAQEEAASDEDAQDESASDEDAQDESVPTGEALENDEQDESDLGEDVRDPWEKDLLGATLDAAVKVPVDPSQVECFYIPAGWRTFLQTVYGKKRYRRLLNRGYTVSLARIESTDMTGKDLMERFPEMEEYFRQKKRLRPKKKKMGRLFGYRKYCWAMVNMAGDKYQLKDYYEENRSRILNLSEAKKYKKLMIMFAPYQKAQKKYADYGQTFTLDEELDEIYYRTLRRNKKGKFARKMQKILKANNK